MVDVLVAVGRGGVGNASQCWTTEGRNLGKVVMDCGTGMVGREDRGLHDTMVLGRFVSGGGWVGG